jgi:hypothetical protein
MADPALHCRSCGASVPAERRFCTTCGELYPAETAERVPTLAGPLVDLAAELRPLLAEKAALGERLEALAVVNDQRPLTPDERRDWEHAYARWRDLGSEITEAVNRVHPRSDADRRTSEVGAIPPGSPVRQPDDRRDPFWRRAP